MSTFVKRYALFSHCKQYRYELHRRWEAEGPRMLFVMLNPSTADGTRDDNTIRACVRIAKANGCGSISVGNVYAYRSTYPAALWDAPYPVGPHNREHLFELAADAQIIVAAWGRHAKQEDAQPVMKLLANYGDVQCLGFNKGGSPKHPLFIRSDTPLTLFAPMSVT
jgi:hypothetical protein